LLPVEAFAAPTSEAAKRSAWSELTRPPEIRGFALGLPLPNRRSIGLL
jgi:hypothetical protein